MDENTTDRDMYSAGAAAAAGLRAGSARANKALTAAVVALMLLLGASTLSTLWLAREPRVQYQTVLVDRSTGEARMLTGIDGERTASEDDWVREGHAFRYVVLRERYMWQTVSDDARLVGLYSARDVGQAYSEWVRGPIAPTELYGREKTIDIEVETVDIMPNGLVARVRFTRTLRNAGDPIGEGKVTHHEATIGFRFMTGAVMHLGDRHENALGYQVVAYDVIDDRRNQGLSS